jgi:hypothetical protein
MLLILPSNTSFSLILSGQIHAWCGTPSVGNQRRPASDGPSLSSRHLRRDDLPVGLCASSIILVDSEPLPAPLAAPAASRPALAGGPSGNTTCSHGIGVPRLRCIPPAAACCVLHLAYAALSVKRLRVSDQAGRGEGAPRHVNPFRIDVAPAAARLAAPLARHSPTATQPV